MATKTKSARTDKAKNELNKRGQDTTARYMHRRGYDILEREWSCVAGTVDIIARDGECLVFADVNTFTDISRGFPEENITKKENSQERSRMELIALAFLAENDYVDMAVRFDVVSVAVVDKDRAMIRHHIGAFSLEK